MYGSTTLFTECGLWTNGYVMWLFCLRPMSHGGDAVTTSKLTPIKANLVGSFCSGCENGLCLLFRGGERHAKY